jgi:hypothetical protein
MSSMLWALCYPDYRLRSTECGSEQPSESDCGSTDKPSTVEDPWGDSGTSTASGKSETTQPTKSSSKTVTKYDPAHYQRGRIQVWDFIVDQQLDFLAGNCVKYICRAGHKNHESELDDWLKVKAYVEKKIASIQHDRNR